MTLTDTTRRTAYVIPADPHAPHLARHIAAQYLGADPRADDALLILSELVTNSALHSASRNRGHIEITIEHHPDTHALRLTVTDDGPAPRVRRPRGEGGYGYALIHAVATRHGATVTGSQGVYWAELT